MPDENVVIGYLRIGRPRHWQGGGRAAERRADQIIRNTQTDMGHEQRSRRRLAPGTFCDLCGNVIAEGEDWNRDHVPPQRLFAFGDFGRSRRRSRHAECSMKPDMNVKFPEFLDLLAEDSWRNVYGGEPEVRPPLDRMERWSAG